MLKSKIRPESLGQERPEELEDRLDPLRSFREDAPACARERVKSVAKTWDMKKGRPFGTTSRISH